MDLESKSWYAAADSPEVCDVPDVKALRNECPICNVTKPKSSCQDGCVSMASASSSGS